MSSTRRALRLVSLYLSSSERTLRWVRVVSTLLAAPYSPRYDPTQLRAALREMEQDPDYSGDVMITWTDNHDKGRRTTYYFFSSGVTPLIASLVDFLSKNVERRMLRVRRATYQTSSSLRNLQEAVCSSTSCTRYNVVDPTYRGGPFRFTDTHFDAPMSLAG